MGVRLNFGSLHVAGLRVGKVAWLSAQPPAEGSPTAVALGDKPAV